MKKFIFLGRGGEEERERQIQRQLLLPVHSLDAWHCCLMSCQWQEPEGYGRHHCHQGSEWAGTRRSSQGLSPGTLMGVGCGNPNLYFNLSSNAYSFISFLKIHIQPSGHYTINMGCSSISSCSLQFRALLFCSF